MSIALAVLFFSGFLLIASCCQKTLDVCKAESAYEYEEQNGQVLYKRASGEVVRIRFGKSAVTVYDAYQHKSAVDEIVVFIYEYGAKNGYQIPRKKGDFAGEIKLHSLLYELGYEKTHTQHADVEYTADERWYVNVMSKLLV